MVDLGFLDFGFLPLQHVQLMYKYSTYIQSCAFICACVTSLFAFMLRIAYPYPCTVQYFVTL